MYDCKGITANSPESSMPELLVLETANSPGSSRPELIVFNCV